MRTVLSAAFLSLMVGCVGVVDAPGGVTPGDDQGGDDDGSGGTPALNVALDQTSVSTELGASPVVTLTLTGSGGFAGAVGVAATVTDHTDWTVVLDNPSVTLTAGGAPAIVKATVTIPSLMGASLSGALKFDVTPAGLAAQSTTSTLTALNQVTLVITEAGGKCVFPTAAQYDVAVGTKVRFLNMSDDMTGMVIHMGDINATGPTGFNHETIGVGHPMNTAYEQTPTGAGTDHWYCHNDGDTRGNQVIVVH